MFRCWSASALCPLISEHGVSSKYWSGCARVTGSVHGTGNSVSAACNNPISPHTATCWIITRSYFLSLTLYLPCSLSLSLSPMRLSTWHSESGCFWSESEIVLSCWWGGLCISFLFGAPTGSHAQPMQTGNCWFAWSADDIGSVVAEAFKHAHTHSFSLISVHTLLLIEKNTHPPRPHDCAEENIQSLWPEDE